MDYDIIIIGAGVVGLGIAQRLSERYDVLVIEKHSSFGKETSSRNSEVIHAGIYYPKDSLKARLCVTGNKMLYDWCRKHDVPSKRIGKYIVAVDDNELGQLEETYIKAKNNGVENIQFADMDLLKVQEPNVKARNALWSPDSGIIDTHKLMYSFETVALSKNADFAYKHEVISIEKENRGYKIIVKGPEGESFAVTSSILVNSAGLHSDTIAEMAGIDVDKENHRLYYSKGNYFRVVPAKSNLVEHLIYPVPPKSLTNLGIHLTVELDGGLKLGPDIQWMESRTLDYNVSSLLHSIFYESVSRYITGLEYDDIYPDYSGIRPKLQNKNGQWRDFIICEESDKGLSGFINLIGIESPGLTCCLSIAEYVNNMLV